MSDDYSDLPEFIQDVVDNPDKYILEDLPANELIDAFRLWPLPEGE